MKRLALFLLFVLLSSFSFAQHFSVSGVIKDAANGETLPGVYVVMQPAYVHAETKGAVTNKAGFYSVTLDTGVYVLHIAYLGYKEVTDTIYLFHNHALNFELQPSAVVTDEVVVTAQRDDHNVTSIEVGKMEMKIETVKALPALFGEVDVLKSIQLLPGVQSATEGNTGFYVRGGGPDQNLILLDEATIYTAGHLFGFFSVFNGDAVKSVEITKSGMPAYYGGRLASILDVYQKEGNLKKYQVDGGIGLIFSRLTVQGPIKKNVASFIVSARRTYADVLMQPFLKKSSPMKGMKFYFYDLNAKINWIINDKHRLYLGAYYGNDKYGFKSKSGDTKAIFNWGNAAVSLRWNYIITPQLFLNTSASFTNYDFGTTMQMSVYEFNLKSGVRDYSLKSELTYLPSFPHQFKFGVHYVFHTLFPNSYDVHAGDAATLSLPTSKPYYAHDLSVYANDEFEVCRWLKVNAGLRYTFFAHIGSFTRYVLDDTYAVVDSIIYRPGQLVKAYNSAEPRLSLRFLIDSATSIKASYTMNYQYLHQASMATVSLPTDVWMPSTDIVKPQIGHQVSLGFYRNFRRNMFETSVDFYYKWLYNLIEYRDGLNLNMININADQMYTFGKGWSYGVEFFVKKAKGRFTGFIGYTLSFTKRKFEELNGGKPFYAKYDRRHDLSINLSYEIIVGKLTASMVFVFASGNTMTIPLGYYFFDGNLITEYSERNAYRLPPYHRLDLSLNWTIKKTAKWETGLNFSIYNVYNHKNPFFIFFETTTDFSPTQFEMETKAYQMSLLPIIPSITWNFSF
ncbi:MAG: TonB-dependent receptor [Bacteroidales bacterium]|nr:TonB-dependent receptor [Bacteroidales bacterium]